MPRILSNTDNEIVIDDARILPNTYNEIVMDMMEEEKKDNTMTAKTSC